LQLDTLASAAQTKSLEIALTSPLSSDPPALIGDPFRLKQILMNFLSNAVKFTNPGGRVLVGWKVDKISDNDEDRKVTISVEDSGIGIGQDRMDRLFHTFSQVDESITRNHGGSGLGLAISQSLARIMHGDAWAESVLGVGSTFHFFVTAAVDPSAVPSGNIFYSLKTPRSAYLLCPNSATRNVIRENLLTFGFSIVVASSSLAEATSVESIDSLVTCQYDFVLICADLLDTSIANIRVAQMKAKLSWLDLCYC